jgi:serine/threonine protein kinase
LPNRGSILVQTLNIDLIGRTLGGFEIREPIGAGGMGTVYQARQQGMDRLVALKVLPAHLAANPVLLERFYQEARSAARLDHPNAVRAIAVGEQDGLHYFAMEYVEGESLARRIARRGRLAEADAIATIAAVGEALEAAHAVGMVHRDVKPENVLITRDGRVKLADLGLVKRLDQDLGLTQAGKGLGTMTYMAPEQFKDAKHADARCDVYALGVTLYTALTGVVPWAGVEPLEMYKRKRREPLPSLRGASPPVSEKTEAAIGRATRPEPTDRFPRVSEFLRALGVATAASRPRRSIESPTAVELDIARPVAARLPADADVADVWYVRYTEAGQRKQLRLRSAEIRQGVRSGRLARDIRVARAEAGPWLHLSGFNEFVDLVAHLSRNKQETKMESDIERTVAALRAGAPLRRRERSWAWVVWLAGCVGLVAAAAAYGWFHRG